MKSQPPSSANASIRRFTTARVAGSYRDTTAGVNQALMMRLYSRCSGGSTCSGIALATAAVPGTDTPCSELKFRQSWTTRSTSS